MTPPPAPGELAPATRERVSALARELLALLDRLRRPGSPREREQLYAQCIPFLSELGALNRPPNHRRELTLLVREANWHLRSLAGLTQVDQNEEQEHAAWAQTSLEALVQLAADPPD